MHEDILLQREVFMGQVDLDLKPYLSDRRRYADVYNGSIFGGRQLLRAEELEPVGTVVTKSDDAASLERISDIIMRQKTTGDMFALWLLENQETIDYSMPVRVMLKEALEYDRQVREIKNAYKLEFREQQGKNRNKGKVGKEGPASGEYLYKVRKTDRIRPVNTLIVYWGNEPWDGPKSLHEFIDFGSEDTELKERLKKLVPEYPLHILDLSMESDYSGYQTELKTVFELYHRRNDKKQFKAYVEGHEECRYLDKETYRIIGRLTNTKELLQKADEKEEKDMCNAIRELIEDGRAEGRIEGENLLAGLISRLFSDSRVEDAKLAVSDESARDRFYREYGLVD